MVFDEHLQGYCRMVFLRPVKAAAAVRVVQRSGAVYWVTRSADVDLAPHIMAGEPVHVWADLDIVFRAASGRVLVKGKEVAKLNTIEIAMARAEARRQ